MECVQQLKILGNSFFIFFFLCQKIEDCQDCQDIGLIGEYRAGLEGKICRGCD